MTPAPADQDARDRARRLLGKNAVVEAGAGTGKTTLLIDRLIFSVLGGGLDLARTAALTFTEKAAGEIKARLARDLGDVLTAAEGRPPDGERGRRAEGLLQELDAHFGRRPEQVRASAAAALQVLDRAPIGTIHHFCSTLLRLFPLASGVDPRFEVDAGQAFEDLFQSEWAAWLDEELGEDAPRRAAWLEVLGLAPLSDLEGTARALCSEEGILARPDAPPEHRERLARLIRGLEAIPAGKAAPRGGILEAMASASARLKELAASLDSPMALPERAEVYEPAECVWPKAWPDSPDEREVYETACAVAKRASAAGHALTTRAAALLEPFSRRFREAYRRRGWVGYQGLLTRSLALVKNDLAARESLKARFDVFLIDEFQDTDPVQGELLLFLAEEPGGGARDWRAVRFAPGKIFVVGDPKQSIYRFRGADIRAYDRFARALLDQGAEFCALQTNFRAGPGLLAPVNAVFEKIMKRDADLQPDYRPVLPRAPDPDGAAPAVEIVLARDGDEEKTGRSDRERALQAGWIARWIADNAPPRKYGDMAVLLRSFTSLDIFLDAFKAAGLPYVVEEDRYFYAAQETADLVNVLRALDDPSDKTSWAGVLRSPLAGFADRDLDALARAGGLSYASDAWLKAGLSEPARLAAPALWARFRALRERAGREPLGDFASRVLRETFLPEFCAAAYHGEQTLINLQKFARLAAEAGESRGATLKEFIGHVVRSARESAREGESPLADEHLDAVRILTVHKAKGLEFPVVFLPDLGSAARGGEPPDRHADWTDKILGLRLPRAGAGDLSMAFLERDVKRREELERTRLLYVAMTRPRERLFLLGGEKPAAGSAAALLRAAGAWPDEAEPDKAPAVAAAMPVRRIDPGAAAPRAVRPSANLPAADLSPRGELWKRRWKEAEAAAARPLFRAPTSLLEEAAPRFAPEKAAAGAALVGQVCHEVLRGWDFAAGGNLETAVAEAVRALALADPSSDWRGAAPEARDVLEFFLSTEAARSLARAEILGREVPFLFDAGEHILRGGLDVLFRQDGRLWVGDYKTDRLSPGGAAARAAHYLPQGRAYADAVKKARNEPCGFRIIYLRTGETVDLIGTGP
ncbi:MAG: UvrD-helicase domain-containing protein [Elusimicrobiota bacterium]